LLSGLCNVPSAFIVANLSAASLRGYALRGAELGFADLRNANLWLFDNPKRQNFGLKSQTQAG
jgi:uncharacterized protein YjbI with pentapeptide repeats